MEPKPTYQTAPTADTRRTGTVKYFNPVRGYGFIIPDDGSAEVFVHYSAIEGDGYRNLYESDRVEYNLVDRGKGPHINTTAGKRP